MSLPYQGQKALVIGLGISGRSAARFLLQRGAIVVGVDRKEDAIQHPEVLALKEQGLRAELDHSFLESELKHFDFVIVSPGVPQTHPLYAAARQVSMPILGEIELGCRHLHHPVIGITGTNGKTTVTLLVAHILNACGKPARALGNIGVPMTQEIDQLKNGEILVLELSSYQLETLCQPVLDAGVILNITPDHLDRYGTMEEYAKAKCKMEQVLKPNGVLYIEERTLQDYGHLIQEKVKTYGYQPGQSICTDQQSVFREGNCECALPNQYKGLMSHDVENFLAAYAICRTFGVEPESFCNAFESFKKPSHRIEFVMEKQGVKYYDDSKGTNLDAVMRAVQTLPGPIILIAGGVDKGAAYTPWLTSFADKVKCVYAIGQAANKISQQLSHQIPVQICETLDQAVQQAAGTAKPGDYVLLSPGCASLDMFRDYAHRGEEFQRVVRAL